mmetsp:Transcript_37284/g.35898  ORF Transcript_37284/g.35898 Transcript_37284/m.35898 type:complete len:139 (-) Transcript_37284:205-621(-)
MRFHLFKLLLLALHQISVLHSLLGVEVEVLKDLLRVLIHHRVHITSPIGHFDGFFVYLGNLGALTVDEVYLSQLSFHVGRLPELRFVVEAVEKETLWVRWLVRVPILSLLPVIQHILLVFRPLSCLPHLEVERFWLGT